MADPARRAGKGKRGRSWRLVGGAFLHFGIVAYLVVVPLAVVLSAPENASTEALLRLGLGYSGWFLAGLLAIGLAATLLAAIVDALRDKGDPAAPRTPAMRSAEALARTRDEAALLPHDEIAARVAEISARAWNHEDPAYQALSRDLAEIVRTSAQALASAPAERRAAIRTRTLLALGHIDQALGQLASHLAAQDESKAHAAALYVEQRYGASDFAIPKD